MSEPFATLIGIAALGALIGGVLFLYGLAIAIVLAPIVWVIRRVWK